jgi:thioredoxin-related protein
MRKFALCLLMCWMAGNLAAEEIKWITSVPEAEALAKKENKLVLLNFTGTDWCPWCIKLDAEVFGKPEFTEFAKKNLVLVQVDFPHNKPQTEELQKANQALQSKYKIQGFPTLIAISPDGTKLWEQVGFPQGGLSSVISGLAKAKKS